MTTIINSCNSCARYIWGDKCIAYPKGIPAKILDGTVDHKKPYKGDGGIIFRDYNEALEELRAKGGLGNG